MTIASGPPRPKLTIKTRTEDLDVLYAQPTNTLHPLAHSLFFSSLVDESDAEGVSRGGAFPTNLMK
jgi:hypothetical protein